MENTINLLIAFGCFQALFLAAFLLINPPRTLRKVIFALLLLTEGMALMENLLFSSGLIESVPHLMGTSYFLGFTRGPLLFLFALCIVQESFKLRWIHVLHFLPFLIMVGLGFQVFLMSASEKLEMIRSISENANNIGARSGSALFLGIFLYVQIGTYSWIAIKMLRKHVQSFKKDLVGKWYLKVIIAFLGFLVIGFLYSVQLSFGLLIIPNFSSINMIIMTLLIQSLAYSFFKRQNFIDSKPKAIKGINVDALISQLEELLIRDKVFLEDSLSINHVAQKLETPVKHLSQVINQRFGHSFKDLINQYRVDAAKALMAGEASDNLQMLDVGLESGFNNKVSFYRVFKKFTGHSPSEYYERLKATQASAQS